MSDSADAIGFSDSDSTARLRFSTSSKIATPHSDPILDPDKPQGGTGNDRLNFPSANLGRMRSPMQGAKRLPAPQSHKSVAAERKRRRILERQRIADEKAAQLAQQLAIEEDEQWEASRKNSLVVLVCAWVVGLFVNASILIFLWFSVASWGADQKPVSLVFSTIEVEAEDQTEVDFVLSTEAGPEDVDIELEQALVEVMTVDAVVATDWSEDPELLADSLAEGLFDPVDAGDSGRRGDSDGGDGKGKGASFFGIESSGDRLVFVVDCSGSMGFEMRFQRAVYELSQSLRMMEKHQEFLVVLYNDRIFPMLDMALLETKPIKASEENIERVMKWLRYQRPVGSTLPARAMRGSLEVQPSSIFFLSDGELADDTQGMLRELNVSNSGTGAIVFGTGLARNMPSLN